MNIDQWLSRRGSAIIAHAVVRVEADEVADAEAMLRLLDGDSVGHYGLHVHLVSTEHPPRMRKTKNGAWRCEPQFGLPNASKLATMVRYYDVIVDRD